MTIHRQIQRRYLLCHNLNLSGHLCTAIIIRLNTILLRNVTNDLHINLSSCQKRSTKYYVALSLCFYISDCIINSLIHNKKHITLYLLYYSYSQKLNLFSPSLDYVIVIVLPQVTTRAMFVSVVILLRSVWYMMPHKSWYLFSVSMMSFSISQLTSHPRKVLKCDAYRVSVSIANWHDCTDFVCNQPIASTSVYIYYGRIQKSKKYFSLFFYFVKNSFYEKLFVKSKTCLQTRVC